MAEYPEGSIWRRWDIHIHTPGTAHNDGYTSWEEYIKALESADKSIAALGITDYLSISGYEKVIEYKGNGRLRNIKLILPNIEFRISPHTKRGSGINLHLLVSPHSQDHIERIKEALSRLCITIQNDTISCSKAGLIRLGGKLSNAAIDDDLAYRAGVNQFKVGFEDFRKWLQSEEWLKRNSLIAVASGSGDGTSGLQNDDGYALIRAEIEKFSQIIFSGTPKDREFWLGKGCVDLATIKKKYNGPKPCLHGSDAHNIDSLFKPELDRFCWIKADPTFEGLRQVIYEPEDRVFIGTEPPSRYNQSMIIRTLELENTHGWFTNDKILLNSGLVAIIGAKGSGKTALADMIAATAGAKLDSRDSFIFRASTHLIDTVAKAAWGDEREISCSLQNLDDADFNPRVRYLSQKFVERLCATDEIGGELQEEIEAVVFSYLDELEKMDASSFHELREMRTQFLHERRAEIRGEISKLNQQINEIDRQEAELPQKKTKREELTKELERVKKQYPKIEDEKTEKVLKQLEDAQKKLADAIEKVGVFRKKLENLNSIRHNVQQFQRDMTEFWDNTKTDLLDLGLDKNAASVFEPVFRGNTRQPLDRLESDLKSNIDKFTGTSEDTIDEDKKPPETVKYWRKYVSKIEKELNIDEQKRKKFMVLKQQANSLEKEITRFSQEMNNFEQQIAPKRNQLIKKRFEIYLGYFELLKKEKIILEQLYEPLRLSLLQRGVHEGKLELYIQTVIDLASWASRGEELIDQRKSGTFRQKNSVLEAAKSHLMQPWQNSDTPRIETGIFKIISLLRDGGNIKSQLRAGYDLVDIADWLFAVEHIKLNYGLRYDGTELQKLSPGTRGIVLLILYLAIDQSDQRPLIVDQPDENLDNQSIYEILRDYFRIAKNRRQVILITHNPNLVVNTDAEQIIIAHCERNELGLPKIRYRSGSLESLDKDQISGFTIRDEVCRLLEGGKEAFEMREKKYFYFEESV